jgi:Zn-dependent metalloprotease
MRRGFAPAAVFLSFACGLALGPARLAAQPLPTAAVRSALAGLEADAGAPLRVTVSPRTGLVTFLALPRGRSAGSASSAAAGARAARPEELAAAFLRSHGALFGLSAEPEVALESARHDGIGMDHVRFRQTVAGVPVTAGEMIVHLLGDGVVAVNAKTLPASQAIDPVPALSSEEAIGRARLVLERYVGAAESAGAEILPPRLEVLNRGLLEDGSWPTRLAWRIEARGLALRELLWIDARDGDLLLRFSQLTSAKSRSVYNANHGSALPGSLMRVEGGPATGNADADLAYQYAGDTYDYYFTHEGRDSFDNAGGALVSTIRYCSGSCPYANAFWNGSQMVYGDGFSAADDVDAHELTHAVTERTAGLYYYMQSGALNESFSDIFGETVDLTNGSGTDTAAVRWQLGEDIPGFGAIRDMRDPTVFADPGKLSDPYVVCNAKSDNGGVHTNSGVPNHAYALMVDGGSYNGFTVSGIGLTKAAAIEYRALTVYLTSGSGFADDANALEQSCADLTGSRGITAADCAEVAKAIDAVQMTAPWPCAGAAPKAPALCPAGQLRTDLFYDGLESGGANWVASTTVGSNAWFLGNNFAASGVWHLSGKDLSSTTDSQAQMAAGVLIPPGGRMQFAHAWQFEFGNNYYDGGVIEVSTNGGATWTDAGALISAGAAYNGTIYSFDTNPLAGRPAFVGPSYGYTGTQLDLSSLAGQTARFRFRVGADSLISDLGWSVDDVRIYRCSCTYAIAPFLAQGNPAGGSGSVSVTTQAGCAWTVSGGPAWLTPGGGGTGSGIATWTAQANPTSTPRSGVLTVAGLPFTVYQGGAADFYTVTPCRVIDTRTTTPLTPGSTRNLPVAGLCGVPPTAKAISANITAVAPTNQGYLTLFAGGTARPEVSTVSFQAGVTRSNSALISLAPDGTGTLNAFGLIANGGQVDLIVDVNGYYQ